MPDKKMSVKQKQAIGLIARTTWKIQWGAGNPHASEEDMANAWEADKKQYYSIARRALGVVSANGIKIG